jgi:hypothetical protein
MDVGRLAGYLRWHAIIWKFGGPTERAFFLAQVLTAYIFLPAVLAWFILTGWDLEFSWEFYVTMGLAVSNIGAFLRVFGIAQYRADSWGELLRRGHFHPHDHIAAEFLSYLQNRGMNGRLPGATELALLDWTLFYGLVALGVGFGLWVLPLIGPATPAAFLAVDATMVFASRRISRSRLPIIYGGRDQAGVQLSEPIFPGYRRGLPK